MNSQRNTEVKPIKKLLETHFSELVQTLSWVQFVNSKLTLFKHSRNPFVGLFGSTTFPNNKNYFGILSSISNNLCGKRLIHYQRLAALWRHLISLNILTFKSFMFSFFSSLQMKILTPFSERENHSKRVLFEACFRSHPLKFSFN